MIDTIIGLLGVIGGFCFAYCGVPAAFATLKAGRSIGTPVSIAWMIFTGSMFMYSYLLLRYGFDLILAINYAIEIFSWGILVVYHYRRDAPLEVQ